MVALKQLGVAALYALLTWVVLAYLAPSGGSSIFFLASGYALAVLLLGDKRYAWGILLGALGANMLLGYPLETILLKSVGSTLGALLGTWLLTRNSKFDASLQILPDYLRLIVLGGFVSSGLSALAGATGLLQAGVLTGETYIDGLFSWWLGDVLGVILLTPLLLLWKRSSGQHPATQPLRETLLVTGITFLAGQIIFMGWFHISIGHVAQVYWMFLFITWVALRLGARWTVLLLAVTAIQAVLGAYQGIGYFAHDLADTHLSNYWFFMVILSLVGMTLSIHLAQRQQAETGLRNRTDELNLYNRILQQIYQGSPLHPLLDALALEVEHLHPGIVCSILLLDEDGQHLRHGAAPSLPNFYNQAIDGLSIGEGVGTCGTAANCGERIIIEDVQQDPAWPTALRLLAYQAGVQSCWSQPIKDGKQRVLGTFAIYHSHPAQPSATEIALIERMADLAARVIEQTRIQNDLRLKDSALNASANAVLITDKAARIQWANQAFSELTGYGLNEAVGFHIRDLVKSGKQTLAYYQTLWETILAGNVWHSELINRHKDGSEYNEEVTITPIKNTAGEITHFIAVMRDVTKRKQAEEQIRTLAFYDTLTHLPNRRLLDDRLKQAMVASKRSGRYGALMFLDLDNFKPLNDTYGHGIGDLLLIEAARRITSCVRRSDTVARFGGDEFVVMLDELDSDRHESIQQAGFVSEKIRLALAEPYVLLPHDGKEALTHRCTSSIGIILFINNAASPASSATGIKSAGETWPSSGLCQRSKASIPTMLPLAISTCGW